MDNAPVACSAVLTLSLESRAARPVGNHRLRGPGTSNPYCLATSLSVTFFWFVPLYPETPDEPYRRYMFLLRFSRFGVTGFFVLAMIWLLHEMKETERVFPTGRPIDQWSAGLCVGGAPHPRTSHSVPVQGKPPLAPPSREGCKIDVVNEQKKPTLSEEALVARN